jgi:putative ABC transport system permease protein
MVRDLRHALQTLARSPGYTALCVAILALGIGANAAIFSVLDAVVIHALPYPDADRLVVIWERFPAMPPPIGPRMFVMRQNFDEWRRQARSFDSMAAFRQDFLNETSTQPPRRVSTGFATASLFPMLGAKARIGRIFTNESERSAVITDEFFESRYQRNPSVIGRSIALNSSVYTIIGVLPPRFHLPSTREGSDQLKPEVWLPVPPPQAKNPPRDLLVLAHLKPGVTVAQARAEMAAIGDRLAKSDAEHNEGWTTSLFDLRTEDTEPEVHQALYVLLGAVAFLLLIACANLANLTLARVTLRTREMAIRLALGASRARIISQLIAEPLLLSIAGAAAGLLFARWCIRLMVAYKPEDIQRPELIAINLPVLIFAALAGIVTTLLFGLAPAFSASRADLNTALKSGGAAGSSLSRVRWRQLMIGGEVAMALVLLTGAGLMIRSFQELLSVGVGFRTDRVTLADIDLPADRYRDDTARSRFFRELVSRTGAASGIEGSAVVDNPPLHRISMSNFFIEGRPDPPMSELPIADKDHGSPSYVSVLGLRLEAGRWFTDRDLPAGNAVPTAVIVNRSFVRQFFPKENPIGHRLLNGDHKEPAEIVGVVSDFRPMGVENGARATIFWPDLRISAASLIVRSPLAADQIASIIRASVAGLDQQLPAPEIRAMKYYVDEWLSQRRFNTFLLVLFAALALILGMLGIYGVLAGLVASRVREIGIRMAIGATPSQIGSLVVKQSMLPVIAGVVAGLAVSLVLARFLESLLFQVQPRDPLTLALAAAAVLCVAPLAIYVPLRRATRVDCTIALREQ